MPQAPSLDEQLDALESAEDLPLSFQIDLENLKKPVKIHLWRSKRSQLSEKLHLCIYTHGAGGTCLSPGSSRLCEGLAAPTSPQDDALLVVLGFDGPMHLGSRTKAFVGLVNWAADSKKVTAISLAGRSMGCRAAVLAATECSAQVRLSRQLVLQSYPLVGAGKGTKDAERKQILLELPDNMRVLFQSGDQDDMCPLEDLRELQKSMKAESYVITLRGADHGLQLASGIAPKGSKSDIEVEYGNTAARIAREWLLADESASLGDGSVHVVTEDDKGTVTWSGFGNVVPEIEQHKEDRSKRPLPEQAAVVEAPLETRRTSKRTKR